ncbi:hypothetical protein M231_01848 [Tremella mesenterica]|uniref:Enhancer of mRNA-decapping protein 4 WD40 repeat region domain-containing protein n=1 Tax=Tremella mesenterica TaxID=5217 RepID=A0A4Q1BS29_TREME|nr:hypothetical protein M231_01848 [Tremella mesenterica]
MPIPRTVITVTEANLDSLFNGQGVDISPVTKMRARSDTYSHGRTVGMTTDWLAYATSKGRVRLVDKATATPAVLEVPDLRDGHIVDMTVSPTSVAVLGSDGSITAFQVPKQWSRENPAVSVMLHVNLTHNTTIGVPRQIEWIKDGRLAVAGTEGVLLVYPRQESANTFSDPQAPMFRTDGSLVSFCLNQTHQAIGLLSETGWFSLWNTASLTRVWHRQLPTSAPNSSISSVTFCETNIIVGRDRNTVLELLQITSEVAVLSSIEFSSPYNDDTSFAQLIYDASKGVLWVASFARSSLFGFKYALKGQAPVRNIPKDTPTVVGFDRMVEIPLQPILSLVLGERPGEDTEIFFVTPTGLDSATIGKSISDTLAGFSQSIVRESPRASQTPILDDIARVRKSSTPYSGNRSLNHSRSSVQRPSVRDDDGDISNGGNESREESDAGRSIHDVEQGVSLDQMAIQIRGSEGRVIKSIKDNLATINQDFNTRIDKMSTELSNDVAGRVERSIKAQLQTLIQNEIKKTVVPAIERTVQNELRTVVSNQVPGAIHDALQSVPRELEKALGPAIQRSISTIVHSSLDRVINESLQTNLIPVMSTSSTQLADQMTSDLKAEMLALRKDFEFPIREAASLSDTTLRQLVNSVSELKTKVSSLSDQLARQSTQPLPQATTTTGPAPTGTNTIPPVQPRRVNEQPADGVNQQYEDMIGTALSAQSTQTLVNLLSEHWAIVDRAVPAQGRPQVSQAVIFTLLYQLGVALNELSPADPMYARVLHMQRRAVGIVEPREQLISSFFGQITPNILASLNNAVQTLTSRWTADPVVIQYIPILRESMAILQHKLMQQSMGQ